MIRADRYVEGEEAAESVDAHDLAAACTRDGLVWIDIEAPTVEEIALVAAQLQLHHLVAEDLEKLQQRTKLVRYGDQVHVAIRDCTLRSLDLETREVDLIITSSWVVTVREAGAQPAGEASLGTTMRHRFEAQRTDHGATTIGFVVWAVLDVVVDRYFEVTDRIDASLDDIEDIVFSNTGDRIPRELFTLRRSLVAFRRAVAPLREVINEMLRREVAAIDSEALYHLQDVLDHVLRMLDLVESQRELLTGLLEGQLAVQSNQMNKVMKATSSWGAILIVATLVAGIYGMNFEHMPELGWQYGSPLSLLTMVAITSVLYRVFKRRGWL